MRKIKKTLKFYFLPLLSSILMGTSYIPFPPWAVFFCYVPLWLFALQQKKIKTLLIGAWLCQFIATLIGFNWVAYTIREFGFFSWPLAILGLLFFASFANLHIPISLFFWFISKKSFLSRFLEKAQEDLPAHKTSKGFEHLSNINLSNQHHKKDEHLSNSKALYLKHTKKTILWFFFMFLSLPLYSALVMKYYPMIFDWNFGYTWLYMKWPAFQTAEIWGFEFLHTLTLFSNLPFLYFSLKLRKYLKLRKESLKLRKEFLQKKSKSFKVILLPIKILLIWFAFFLALNIYGWYLKSRLPKPDQSASVLLVQPNTENLSVLSKKSKADPRSFVLKTLIQKTLEGLKDNPQRKIDFILWPEGAYPYRIQHDTKTVKNNPAQRKARKWQIPILLSAIGQNKNKISNSVFVFDQEGKLVNAPYDKTLLLAFGEYIPGEKWLPIDKLFAYYNRSFTRGTGENKVASLNGINLGFQICYEGLFDFFTRDLALKKAQIIVNVTNDSWYGSWQEPYQHLYMTLGRAIEVRRPLIRGTNTGISGLISAKGEISPLSSINKSLSRIYSIPYYSQAKQTIFTSWGYYIDQYFLWFLFLCLLFFYILTSKKLKIFS